MALAPGVHVGPYEITTSIGTGGMGEVYKAFDSRLRRPVAIKVLRVDKTADGERHRRLLREARAVAALKHQHICTIHDVGEHEGQPFIVMEYLEGRSLSKHIPRDGLPLESILRYGTQIAGALAHAHAKGIVHRDLKASNVVFDAAGDLKVLDFGLAKRVSHQEKDHVTATGDASPTGESLAGTIPYMPPEVLRGGPADERADIWSLGVLLSRMASGRLPFRGETEWETMAAIQRDPPAPLPASVPPSLRNVVGRCLAKEPAQRYERASEVRAALESISADVAVGRVAAAGPVAAPSAPDPATAETPRPSDPTGSTVRSYDPGTADSESLRRIERLLRPIMLVSRLIGAIAVGSLVLGFLGFVNRKIFEWALLVPSDTTLPQYAIAGLQGLAPLLLRMLLAFIYIAVTLTLMRLLGSLTRKTGWGRQLRLVGARLKSQANTAFESSDGTLVAGLFVIVSFASLLIVAWLSWDIVSVIDQMIMQPSLEGIDVSVLGPANWPHVHVIEWTVVTLGLLWAAGWWTLFPALARRDEAGGMLRLMKLTSVAPMVCILLFAVGPWRLVWDGERELISFDGNPAFIVSERPGVLYLYVPGAPAARIAISEDDPRIDRGAESVTREMFGARE